MTRYRLKKDTPEFKAGTVFDMIENVDVGKVLTMNAPSEDAYAFEVDSIDNFDEWFEEVKESGWWGPKLGDIYYVAYPDGLIASCTWDGCTVDMNRFLNGAVFKTKEATKRWRDYLKAITTVRQDEGVLTPEQPAENDYVYYIRADGESQLAVHGFNADYTSVNTLAFNTREHAKASLDKHPDEWKIIANYDWSRE